MLLLQDLEKSFLLKSCSTISRDSIESTTPTSGWQGDDDDRVQISFNEDFQLDSLRKLLELAFGLFLSVSKICNIEQIKTFFNANLLKNSWLQFWTSLEETKHVVT